MNEPYQTIRMTSHWRGRMRFARDQSLRARMLDCVLPMLWALALIVAAAVSFW